MVFLLASPVGGMPLKLINLVTPFQFILPAEPAGHRTGDLNYRGRNTDAQNNRVSQLEEPLSSPNIRFYTWWTWSSERPEDTPKVAEWASGRSGSVEHTSQSPGLQSLFFPAATATEGQESLWWQKWASSRCREAVFRTSSFCLPPILKKGLIDQECGRELKLILGEKTLICNS